MPDLSDLTNSIADISETPDWVQSITNLNVQPRTESALFTFRTKLKCNPAILLFLYETGDPKIDCNPTNEDGTLKGAISFNWETLSLPKQTNHNFELFGLDQGKKYWYKINIENSEYSVFNGTKIVQPLEKSGIFETYKRNVFVDFRTLSIEDDGDFWSAGDFTFRASLYGKKANESSYQLIDPGNAWDSDFSTNDTVDWHFNTYSRNVVLEHSGEEETLPQDFGFHTLTSDPTPDFIAVQILCQEDDITIDDIIANGGAFIYIGTKPSDVLEEDFQKFYKAVNLITKTSFIDLPRYPEEAVTMDFFGQSPLVYVKNFEVFIEFEARLRITFNVELAFSNIKKPAFEPYPFIVSHSLDVNGIPQPSPIPKKRKKLLFPQPFTIEEQTKIHQYNHETFLLSLVLDEKGNLFHSVNYRTPIKRIRKPQWQSTSDYLIKKTSGISFKQSEFLLFSITEKDQLLMTAIYLDSIVEKKPRHELLKIQATQTPTLVSLGNGNVGIYVSNTEGVLFSFYIQANEEYESSPKLTELGTGFDKYCAVTQTEKDGLELFATKINGTIARLPLDKTGQKTDSGWSTWGEVPRDLTNLAFTPDGRVLVATCNNGTIMITPADTHCAQWFSI